MYKTLVAAIVEKKTTAFCFNFPAPVPPAKPFRSIHYARFNPLTRREATNQHKEIPRKNPLTTNEIKARGHPTRGKEAVRVDEEKQRHHTYE